MFVILGCLIVAVYSFYHFGKLGYFGTQREEPQMPPLSDLPKYYSTKLPQEQIYFVGRNVELQTLMKLLDFRDSKSKIIGIFGGPGIGKSTLAIKAGHEVSIDNVTVEYFDLSEVLYVPHLLHKLLGGVTNSTQHSVMMEELKVWAEKSNSFKVLIFDGCDNIFNSNQKGVVQKVFDILIKHTNNIKIIFTSKHIVTFIGHYKSMTLEELSIEHAVELLRKLNSKLSEKDAKTIANAVGNVPLALQVVGALLETNTVSPETIVTEITTNPLKALSPEALIESDQVQTTLQVSYDNLNDEYIQRCARFLANFPGSFSRDAAIGILTYMINDTYWYAQLLHELEIYLNWVPKPSKCLDTLVFRSLLKHHSNSQRYSFHKLVKMFLMTMQSHDSEQKNNEMFQFKRGFVYYFADYWDSFHKTVDEGHYDPQIIAALDLERHNFEFMESILPELGSDISYISRYTELAELYASYSNSLMDYFKHSKETKILFDTEKTTTLDDRRQIVAMLDLHSRAVITDKGPRHYVEIFVEMIIQVSILEDYYSGTKVALETLKSRKIRIMELHKKYGSQVDTFAIKYFDQVKKYSLEVEDLDTFMETLQVKTGLTWPIKKCSKVHCSNFKKGRAYFGAQQFEKAIEHYEKYLNLNKNIPEHKYLYTIVMLYYCHHFSGNQKKATNIAKRLDTTLIKRKLYALEVNKRSYKKVEIIMLFYGKVRPGTPEHSTLSKLLYTYYNPAIIRFQISEGNYCNSCSRC